MALGAAGDIQFPHAILSALAHLKRHPGHVATQGYVLDAAVTTDRIDIHGCALSLDGAESEDRLRRVHEVLQGCRSFFSAVFRKDAFLRASESCLATKGSAFQELAFCATLALQGKIKCIPIVQALRSNAHSRIPLAQDNAFFWFLEDVGSFSEAYAVYRRVLLAVLQEEDKAGGGTGEDRGHIVDILHGALFAREIDTGMLNHRARELIGDLMPRLIPARPQAPPRSLQEGDVLHHASGKPRAYVWRHAVLSRTSPGGVVASGKEIARVEAALDDFPAVAEPQA